MITSPTIPFPQKKEIYDSSRKKAAKVLTAFQERRVLHHDASNAVAQHARIATYISLDGVVDKTSQGIAAAAADDGAKYAMEHLSDSNRIKATQDYTAEVFDNLASANGIEISDQAKSVAMINARHAYDMVIRQANENAEMPKPNHPISKHHWDANVEAAFP